MSEHAEKVVVVGEQFCQPYPVELEVAEKKVTIGKDFVIKDVQNNVVFKLDSRRLSIRLDNAEGRPILWAQKIDRYGKWEVLLGDKFDESTSLFRAERANWEILKVFLAGNKSTDPPDFTVKGDFLQRQAHILRSDTKDVVAEVKKKYTPGNVVMDNDAFTVAVWPNVDQAFITTLIVILDEIY